MDFAATATAIAASAAGLTTIGAAAYGIFLLIKGFVWGRKVVK